MKRVITLTFLISLCTFARCEERIFLSPDGCDRNSGSKESPLLTLNKAIQMGISTTKNDTLFIEVAAGDYFMENTLEITGANSRPIVIESNTAEKPRFIGGIKIEGWEEYKDGIFRAYIPEVKRFHFNFEQFFIDGKRATAARTPNKEWYFVQGSSEVAHVQGLRSPVYGTQKIKLNPENLTTLNSLTKEELQDVRVRFYHKWDNTQKGIEYHEKDSSYIYISGGGMKPWNQITKGSRYMMSGYRGALDIADEWYLNKRDGYIYYIPKEDEDMSKVEAIAPTLEKLVVFKGTKDAPLSNISFKNISFQYSSFLMPKKGNEPMQAAASIAAALEFDYTENLQLEDCEVQHTGGYGVWLKRECHNNTIERCYIADLGAGGIKIGEPYFREDNSVVTSNNTVNNSIITKGGSELPCGVGVAIFHAANNKVTHNEISDLLYSGVSVGWVWGYNGTAPKWTNVIDDAGVVDFKQLTLVSPAKNNLVAYNHIHHIGWGELSDMGAVYTLGESPGTRITHNVIHDILSYDYGGWGLYTDEGSTGVEMSYNLVYRCKSGGFHQHYGKNNKIENNILAYGHYYQSQYTRAEDHLSFSFKRNIILQDKGKTLAGAWKDGKIDVKDNIFWHLKGDSLSIDGFKDFEEFKRLKEDNSIIADPLFNDPANDDYTFKSKRAIKKIGFEIFDYSKVGVYGSEAWINKAKLDEETLSRFREAAAIRLER